MNIGNVSHKSFILGSGENKETKRYIEMIIRIPFMESATFRISKNEKKQNKNEPDWNIYYSYNRKSEKYRRARVGALWDKRKDELEYKTGHIETPLMPNGRLNITLFKSKQLEGEVEQPSWTHDVIWTFYKAEENTQNYEESSYNQIPSTHTSVVIDVDEDEIPF